MKSTVFFATAKQAWLDDSETLPCKLDRILERLKIADRVKDERVCIKMHLGGNVGYSTIHPVFVRRVVKAVLDGGGKPFVTDTAGAVATAHERGYTHETLGCPIYPIAGPDERHVYWKKRPYKNIEQWGLAGEIADATFLIDLAHVKGHPSCAYGGAIKNLALGAMIATTRGAIHDTVHFDPYWFPEKCTDPKMIEKIIASCPFGALVHDRDDARRIHLHTEPCNQCGRCLKVAPKGSLKIDPANFRSFMEACAISAKLCLDTFDREKTVFINVAIHMTAVCDCFGFTGPAILNDVGIFGSDDIVAVEQATLDALAPMKIIEENVPSVFELQPNAPHPLASLHGPLKNPYIVVEECEKLGLGRRDYKLVDVLPYKDSRSKAGAPYVAASGL
ncbi:MAG: DUF362 domain-containing protein [Candidatus Sumerlaeia bacterium]|nr:DUF362 domain-containing protein [Candidatus Sumerlaeia bacterium]